MLLLFRTIAAKDAFRNLVYGHARRIVSKSSMLLNISHQHFNEEALAVKVSPKLNIKNKKLLPRLHR